MSRWSDLDEAENWHGGFYELAVNLGPRSDARLDLALTTVWSSAQVRGCHQRTAAGHVPTTCTLESLEGAGHLAGTVKIPGGRELVCGAVAIREEGGDDWLDFYLPLGALGGSDSRVGAFPFGTDGDATSRRWREPLDEWLVALGAAVYAKVPFRYAVVGFEASGLTLDDVLGNRDTYYSVLDGRGGTLVVIGASRWDFGTPG
jgi:hypothetical protein